MKKLRLVFQKSSVSTLGSFLAHILLFSLVIGLAKKSEGLMLPPSIEATIMSMHMVDAGSGDGLKSEANQLVEEADEALNSDNEDLVSQDLSQDLRQKETKAEDTLEVAGKEDVHEEQEPQEMDLPAIIDKKKEVEKKLSPKAEAKEKINPELDKNKKNRIVKDRANNPNKKSNIATATGKAGDNKTSKNVSRGAGSGNYKSKDAGSGHGQAQHNLLAYLHSQILRYKRYPNSARRLGLEGVVNINIKIDSNGHLVTARLMSKESHPILRDATLNIIKNLKKNWSQQMTAKAINVTIPVRYLLVEKS